ncbi:hypothetical protein L3Y34_000855 [Caenorhabditis briggsae]|uniref:Rab-GAP TBC domain-containing protein n=1 Tax=Caenorhabditis briggsae TaxID=6238 RepID=A0AAE9IPI7_CAEBR|nr:hypothetical protein L3Y34_000855 [Caenorhabditis briggsae]
MQMFRHSSADVWKAKKPTLERRSTDGRRSSVVDWINGLSDNNNYKTDLWVEKHDEGCERVTRNGSVCAVEESEPDVPTQHKEVLLTKLKIEIKNIMAEHGAKNYLNLNSPYVTSLCVAVDACLMDGLRRRLLTLFNSPSSMSLLQIIAKSNGSAQQVLDQTKTIEEHHTSVIPVHLIWIREALYMKSLPIIINHFIDSKSVRRYYDSTALLMDPVKGRLVATLLLAPCMVTYRRMSSRTQKEATAEELVEGAFRARNGENSGSTSGVGGSRPPLSITRQVSSIAASVERNGSVSRDYVFSLHHSCKSTLLYGKNNVCVSMNGGDFAKGYMSLQKFYDGNLTLKWVPNQLMHASSQPSSGHSNNGEFTNFWKNTINIEMQDIIYIHLHQKDESSPTCLTFVNCEGVQSAPFQLPAGQHSIAFLSSLETGLAPLLRLDPPLWTNLTKEKILPRLRKRSTAVANPAMLDYVFRLVRTSGVEPAPEDIEDPLAPSPIPPMHDNCVSLPNSPYIVDNVDSIVNFQIGKACQSMRNQIMARAFYGWLTYVRHLRTIRTHLLHLVDTKTLICDDDCDPVDEKFWKQCRAEPTKENEEEFLKRVYWRGIEGVNSKEIRRMAWPYLLGLFEWNEYPEGRFEQFTKQYWEDIEEWRVLEAEVRRRDEEAFRAARARRAGSPVREESCEVFEDPNEPTCSQHYDRENLISLFRANLHRIDKDVERCDRNLMFFSNKDNLESLRRVMYTYVRRNLEEGYTQGMCDLLAPLLVTFEDEALTLECFSILMIRQRGKFPQRPGMSKCLLNLRSLIQVVDPQIYGLIADIDYAQALSFAFRWFLLDFKRELSYECTYKVWEVIWAAQRLRITNDFSIFFGLATITNYHDVLITNNFDYTDMIKFFNEMAERHDCSRLLSSARTHVKCLQNLVQHLK